VDHCGALLKTAIRKEMLANRVYRSVEQVVDYLKTINFLDLQHTQPGREDASGCFYSGLHTALVKPGDVAVSRADWKPIDAIGTHKIHQLITTSTPGELLVRECSCFSCPPCEDGDFLHCQRTEELGPLIPIKMIRSSSSIPDARAETRTRSGQEEHRVALASLAVPGSVIAIAQGPRQTMTMVLVDKAMGELRHQDELKGRKLIQASSQANQFTSTKAKVITFNAALVRTPPLIVTSKAVKTGLKSRTIYTINDSEFTVLQNEFLT
jgi:hypothetical protein